MRLSRWLAACALSLWLAGSALAGQPQTGGGPVQACTAPDQANACVSGAFTATGTSTNFVAQGAFNIVIYGSSGPNGSWNATVQIERSFDGGTTWLIAGVGGTGTQAIYSTNNQDVSVVADEPERGVLYRLHCTIYASGTINYRISTTGSSGSTTSWQP